MDDYKKEFTQALLADCIQVLGKDVSDVVSTLLWKHLNDYTVTRECMALTQDVLNPNEWYLKQFLAIKMIKGLSSRTLKRYASDIKIFYRYVNKSVPDTTTNDIRYFLAVKTSENISKITVNNYLLSLRSFFDTLYDEGYVPNNPTKKIERIKENKVIKKPLSGEEIEKIRDAFKDMPRERALLEVLLSTGCRVSEIVGINREDVDETRITVTGKGNKQRVVFLNEQARFALKKYLVTRTDDNPALFVGKAHSSKEYKRLAQGRIEQIFRDVGHACGIEKCHPHRFRRTMATNALRNGMPIEQVSLMLGHNQLTTTQIYARSEVSDIEASHKKFVR